MRALAETLLLANPIGFMRKRDLAIVGVLLAIAACSFLLFVLSVARARSRRHDVPCPPAPPPEPPAHPAPPPEEVSKTRGVR